jgi:ribosomal protein L11 methyltransferase
VAFRAELAEEARAAMLELFPAGLEEATAAGGELLLAGYGDPAGAERAREAFPEAVVEQVPRGWEHTWRRFHRPVRVGPLWIGPPWEEPEPGSVAVIVDPGFAFGTGAHPTTQLCLELLLELRRSSVLDVGCGSGVLAIAAAKLGFGPVVAIDHDPLAVAAASANASANETAIEVLELDALVAALPRSEAAVANVTLNAVEAVAPRLPARTLIASGYLAADRPAPPGWSSADRRELDGWAADLLLRA